MADEIRLAAVRPHPGSGGRPAARRRTRPWATASSSACPAGPPSSTNGPHEVADDSRSASTPPCSSTTCARSPPSRSATGSPARCTTASRRRSSGWATSSTRSSRSATSADPRARLDAARRDHPAGLGDPVLHLRPAPRGHRRPPVRLAGRLRPRGQPRHRPAGAPVPGRVRPAAAPAHGHRGAAGRAGGHRQRPQARARGQPVGHPRLRRHRPAASRSRTTGSATPDRATATGACRRMRERADGVGAALDVSPRPDGGTVVTLRSASDRSLTKERAPMSTTVLLVDDHELIRQGLARAFERDDDMTVVGQAGSVAEGWRRGRTSDPTSWSPTSSCPTGTASTSCAPSARRATPPASSCSPCTPATTRSSPPWRRAPRRSSARTARPPRSSAPPSTPPWRRAPSCAPG